VNTDAAYNNVRNMIESMVADTDPTTKTTLVPASQLSDQELVERAKLVCTEYNPEGNPPGTDGGPSMKRLLNLFSVTRNSPDKILPKVRRYSVGTWKHSADNKPAQKAVSDPPPLEMAASVSAWGDKQFAVSTIKKTTSERPQGSRQVKAPARLGHDTSGTKGIDTSIRASTSRLTNRNVFLSLASTASSVLERW
jgi:hypothetical protein